MTTSRLPFNSISKAVWSRLEVDLATAGPGGIKVPAFTFTPQGQAPPFVAIGPWTSNDRGASFKSSILTEVTAAINVFTQEESTFWVNSIMGKVLNAFERSMVLDDNFEIVLQDHDICEVIPEYYPEGPVQHGIVRMRWRVEDNLRR